MPAAQGEGDLECVGYVSAFAAQSTGRAFLSINQLGLFVTNDGGKTWELTFRVAAHAQRPIIFIDSLHGWFADDSQIDSVVSWTTDGGVTWDGSVVR